MAKTIVALYNDLEHVQRVISDLIGNGIERDHISLVSIQSLIGVGSTEEKSGEEIVLAERENNEAGSGARLGKLRGLLAGLGELSIPGIGPALAAGPLAVAMSGVAGAGIGDLPGRSAGGLISALGSLGVGAEQAGYYAEGVRRGSALMTVRTNDPSAQRVVDIMNSHEPSDLRQKVSLWRAAGWTHFDPEGTIYREEPPQAEVNPEPSPIEPGDSSTAAPPAEDIDMAPLDQS